MRKKSSMTSLHITRNSTVLFLIVMFVSFMTSEVSEVYSQSASSPRFVAPVFSNPSNSDAEDADVEETEPEPSEVQDLNENDDLIHPSDTSESSDEDGEDAQEEETDETVVISSIGKNQTSRSFLQA